MLRPPENGADRSRTREPARIFPAPRGPYVSKAGLGRGGGAGRPAVSRVSARASARLLPNAPGSKLCRLACCLAGPEMVITLKSQPICGAVSCTSGSAGPDGSVSGRWRSRSLAQSLGLPSVFDLDRHARPFALPTVDARSYRRCLIFAEQVRRDRNHCCSLT
jgi:hypothetical protein